MKRKSFLLTLLMLLVGVVNAQSLDGKWVAAIGDRVAALEGLTDGYYLMKNSGRNAYAYESSSDSKLRLWAEDPNDIKKNKAGEMLDYVVKVAKSNENYTFQFESGKYMPTVKKSVVVETKDAVANFTLTLASEGKFIIRNNPDNTIRLNGNGFDYGKDAATIVGWDDDGGNSQYEFYPVTVEDVPTDVAITVEYKLGDRVVTTVNLSLPVGSIIPAADNLPAFTALSAETTKEVVEGTTTYSFAVVQDIPFEVSDNFDNAVWQTFMMHTNFPRYLQYDGDGVVNGNQSVTLQDNQLWAFVGNILDGFTIYNKTAGSAYTLNKPGTGSERTGMSTENTNNKFKLCTSDVSEAVCFRLVEDGENNVYLNIQNINTGGGQVLTWSSRDAGSSCRFFSPGSFSVNNASQYVVPAFAEAYLSKLVGFPSGLVAEYVTFKSAYEAVSSNNYDVANSQTLYGYINNLGEAPAFDSNKYYRALNRHNSQDLLVVNSNANLRHGTASNAANSVITFESVPDKENVFYIQLEGVYAGQAKVGGWGGDLNVVGADGTRGEYVVEAVPNTTLLYRFKDETALSAAGGLKYIHAAGGNGADQRVVNYNADGAASHWYLIEAESVDVTLNAAASESYATCYYPFPVTIGEGLNAYVGEGDVANGELNLTKATTIAANNGFILESPTKATSATLTIGGTDGATGSIGGTNREVAFSETVLRADYLIFGSIDAGVTVGFYAPAESITSLAANKAYLDNTVAGGAVKLIFPGAVTGIESIDNGQLRMDNEIIYDLSGRRVLAPAKGGVYVKNGKKFIVK